jgi:hypothetical protein
MYGISYMFRHYIAILRDGSYCLLRDAQMRSRENIVDGRVVFSGVVLPHRPSVVGVRECARCNSFVAVLPVMFRQG